MPEDIGATLPGQALVSDQAASRLAPSGFDPSRWPWHSPDTFPRDGSICAVIYRPWQMVSSQPQIQLAQWIDLYGNGGKLCGPWNYDSTPYNEGWLSLAELADAQAIEARRAETGTGSVHESTVGDSRGAQGEAS